MGSDCKRCEKYAEVIKILRQGTARMKWSKGGKRKRLSPFKNRKRPQTDHRRSGGLKNKK